MLFFTKFKISLKSTGKDFKYRLKYPCLDKMNITNELWTTILESAHYCNPVEYHLRPFFLLNRTMALRGFLVLYNETNWSIISR